MTPRTAPSPDRTPTRTEPHRLTDAAVQRVAPLLAEALGRPTRPDPPPRPGQGAAAIRTPSER